MHKDLPHVSCRHEDTLVFGKNIIVVILPGYSTGRIPDLITGKYSAVAECTMKIYRLPDAFLDQVGINKAVDRVFKRLYKINAWIELCTYEVLKSYVVIPMLNDFFPSSHATRSASKMLLEYSSYLSRKS